MYRHVILLMLGILAVLPLSAQADKQDVRRGNRHFRKGDFREAEIDYRKAVLRDSLSLKAQYNLASALYREEDYESAAKALESVSEQGAQNSDYHFNAGDVALQRKDYAAAVESFKQALLLNPSDLEAKENYIYARKMLENQEQNGGGDSQNDQNQDQNQDQDQDQNQNQNQDDNQDNGQDNSGGDNQDRGDSQAQQGISKQQAAQVLRAIQAKESQTQEKVNREKALMLESSQKEKNW